MTVAVCEQPTPGSEWRELIMGAMPLNFGIQFGDLAEKVQDAWEEWPHPPVTSLAIAVVALASRGELRINDQVIFRGEEAEQPVAS